MTEPTKEPRLRDLWRQFLPLSVSDVTMACGDPMLTTTLAHLPAARDNIGAVGVAKALAVFFESAVIMVLHASTTLSADQRAFKAFGRFALALAGGLSVAFAALAVPGVYEAFARHVLRLDDAMAARSHAVLLFLLAWPALSAWRRYFQGLLIRRGHGKDIGRGGILRLAAVAAILAWGFRAQWDGPVLAGTALLGGILTEALAVTAMAARRGVRPGVPDGEAAPAGLPTDMRGVWRFYWPLAISMLVVWGARALLLAIVARAEDGPLALAAWPAAWGLVLVVANATRMVQQVVIRHRQALPAARLLLFAASVGAACASLLAVVGLSPWGAAFVSAFVGKDPALVASMRPLIGVCAVVPLLVAVQNALQGLLIGAGRTRLVNVATWGGAVALLAVTAAAIRFGAPGAMAAAVAMVAALALETAWLSALLGILPRPWRPFRARVALAVKEDAPC